VSPPIYWGFWKNESTTDGDTVTDGLDAAAGKRPSIVVFVRPWYNSGYVDPASFAALTTTIRGHGQIPLIGWRTESWAGTPPAALDNNTIAGGAHDTFLASFADQIKALGYPVMILLDEEMNGPWNAWYDAAGTSFVNMWRHVVNVFRARGAFNATFVWCANGVAPGGVLSPWWPGAAYVDWAGVDVFNTTYTNGAPPLSFDQILHGDGSWWGDSWTPLLALDTTGKVRYALTSFGSDNRTQAGVNDFAARAAWIKDAYGVQIPNAAGAARDYSKLEMVLWFDQNEAHAGPITQDNWDITDDAPSTAAFRAPSGIGSALYVAGNTFVLPTALAPLRPMVQTSQPDPLATAILSTSGLQGFWILDQASGTLLDTSGNARNLTTNGAPTLNQPRVVPSSLRPAVSFPGATTTWLDAGDISAWSIPTTGQLTAGCAFSVPSLPAGGSFYTLMSVAGGSGYEWALRVLSDGRVEFITWDLGGDTASSAAAGAITPGQRYLAVFAIDNTKAGSGSGASRSNVYLIPQSGVVAAAASADTITFTLADGTGTLQIGRRGDATGAMASGSRIGYAFVTNTEVTPVTIQAYLSAFQSPVMAALTGNQPAATGVTTKIWTGHRSLTGAEPAASGVASRRLHAFRSLAGIQPSESGFAITFGQVTRSLTGAEPSAHGVVTRPTGHTVSGNQPSANGGLSDVSILLSEFWYPRMLSWLPEMWYGRSHITEALLDAEGNVLDQAQFDIDSVRNGRLPELALDWSISRLEAECGLSPRPELSLDERRSRIIAHFRGIGSTLARLKAISATWQYGAIEPVADPESYTIYITFIDTRGVPAAIEDHKAEMRANVEAHLDIVWSFTYLLWGDPKRLGITWGQLKTAGRTWGVLKTMKPGDLP
jgi:hypothetical protein